MSNPDRFSPESLELDGNYYTRMKLVPCGEYVLFSDFEKLRCRVKALTKKAEAGYYLRLKIERGEPADDICDQYDHFIRMANQFGAQA